MNSWLLWIVGFLGVSGTLLAVAIFFLGWPALIGTKIGRIALAVGAGVLAVFGIYGAAKSKGRAAERARLARITAKEVINAAAERKRIDAMSDEEVSAELAHWDRPS